MYNDTMNSSDYYKALGVAESADKAEIKKVFRGLAKKYHPDRNPGDKAAEARFKEISEAYETLSDDKKRAEYDTMRRYGAFSGGPTGGFSGNPFGAGGGFDFSQFTGGGRPGGGACTFHFGTGGGGADINDLFSQILGGQAGASPFGGRPKTPRRRSRNRGSDISAIVTISFMESVQGTTRMIQTRDKGQKLAVKIPAGIRHNGKIRLAGQGHYGSYGGDRGNLIITVKVMKDQNFERKGNDIYSTVEISFIEAIKGCKKNVKTLTRTVALTIPPGTQPGANMRLKGMGLAVGEKSGDHYVTINVTIPKTLTEQQEKLLDDWEPTSGG